MIIDDKRLWLGEKRPKTASGLERKKKWIKIFGLRFIFYPGDGLISLNLIGVLSVSFFPFGKVIHDLLNISLSFLYTLSLSLSSLFLSLSFSLFSLLLSLTFLQVNFFK